MKVRLLLLLALFGLASLSAQEKKWNLEANYSVVPAAGFGGEDNVYELGVKYRLLQNDILNLGLGINGGFFSRTDRITERSMVLQPRVFSEFHLPFSKRLKPSVAVGYSYIYDYQGATNGLWGFNLNLGLSYDITDQWFVQFQYDRIGLSQINNTEGFNNFRLGIGFRF